MVKHSVGVAGISARGGCAFGAEPTTASSHSEKSLSFDWSGCRGSNPGPHGPHPCALPTELQPESVSKPGFPLANGARTEVFRARPVRLHVPSTDRIWLDLLERAPDVPELGCSRCLRIGITLESTARARRTAWGPPQATTVAGDVDPKLAGCPRSLSDGAMEPVRVYP